MNEKQNKKGFRVFSNSFLMVMAKTSSLFEVARKSKINFNKDIFSQLLTLVVWTESEFSFDYLFSYFSLIHFYKKYIAIVFLKLTHIIVRQVLKTFKFNQNDFILF